MYTTKPLSLFKSHPEEAFRPPPEGQNSGYVVVKDAAANDGEDGQTCCWGSCGGTRVWELPFPQNRVLTVRYSETEQETSFADAVVFVPVLDLPLSSNRYHAVIAAGEHKGLVRACSRVADMVTCCFRRCVKDVEPRPFLPADVYQQMEIVQHRRGRFTARAVAADGFPHFLYRKKYWHAFASKPVNFDHADAPGLNAALRSHQPSSAGISIRCDGISPPANTAVGKWYCPFYLIKEGGVSPPIQMERSAFYEVLLWRRWEQVHALGGGSKLASKKAFIYGSVEAKQEAAGSSRHGDVYVWFKAASTGQRIGVCTSLWDRMRWEEYRDGWVDEEEDAGKVAGGSVPVERFVVKRMDGSVAVTFDFVHLNKVRSNQV